MQVTAATSVVMQLLWNQGLCEHNARLDSLPVQDTSSMANIGLLTLTS
jgi:hypothetical protein